MGNGRRGDRGLCLSPDAWVREVKGTGKCACHLMHGEWKDGGYGIVPATLCMVMGSEGVREICLSPNAWGREG